MKTQGLKKIFVLGGALVFALSFVIGAFCLVEGSKVYAEEEATFDEYYIAGEGFNRYSTIGDADLKSSLDEYISSAMVEYFNTGTNFLGLEEFGQTFTKSSVGRLLSVEYDASSQVFTIDGTVGSEHCELYVLAPYLEYLICPGDESVVLKFEYVSGSLSFDVSSGVYSDVDTVLGIYLNDYYAHLKERFCRTDIHSTSATNLSYALHPFSDPMANKGGIDMAYGKPTGSVNALQLFFRDAGVFNNFKFRLSLERLTDDRILELSTDAEKLDEYVKEPYNFSLAVQNYTFLMNSFVEAYLAGQDSVYGSDVDADVGSLFWEIINAPSRFFSSILDFDVFGINIYSLVKVVLTLLLLAWIIKVLL